jgi:hypothetical protein
MGLKKGKNTKKFSSARGVVFVILSMKTMEQRRGFAGAYQKILSLY